MTYLGSELREIRRSSSSDQKKPYTEQKELGQRLSDSPQKIYSSVVHKKLKLTGLSRGCSQ
jgi:hypothetical protein